MTTKIIAQFIICTILCYGFWHHSLATNVSDLYQRGMELRDSGNWEEALKIWLTAKNSSGAQSQPDPRIGMAFIELATQKQATDYYEQASKIYFWGFAQKNINQYKKEIHQEIERIAPLLSKEESALWFKYLDRGDAGLLNKIKGFWIKKDPIPTSEINERLIEHWERIAFAKEKFNVENTTVYATDDRGLVFVKYGAPDKKYSGKLGIDQLEIMRWLDDFSLRQEIQRFNTTPEFEIWLYKNLKPKESTIFLFGKRGGFAKYGLRYGLEDFIPERAFRRNSMQTTRGILPGAMLQLMYYSELIRVDRYYLDRFRELEALWANARASGRLSPDYEVIKGLISHYRSIDKTTAAFKYLSLDKTDALEGLESLDLKFKQFRYLDNKQTPRLCLMAVATAKDINKLDFTPFFRAAQKSKYKQRHILLTYDKNWDVKDKIINYPALKNMTTSTFSLTQSHDSSHYSLVAEKVLLDLRKTEIAELDIPDTAKVIGIGAALLGSIPPLSSDTTKFEVSDLLLGVKTPARVDEAMFYPFPVIPKDPLKPTEPLMLYVELYHLKIGKNNKSAFHFDCDIKRIKTKGKIDKTKERLSKKFTFEAFERDVKKTIAIEIKTLIPGEYEFRLKVTDQNSKKNVVRKSSFRIIG